MNYKTLFKPRKLAAAIKRRWDERAMLHRAIKIGVERFKNDPNYRLDLVPSNFAPHKGLKRDDSALLKRIATAYQKAKAAQRSAGETYNVSNEWLPIYENTLGPVMRALQEGDLIKLDRMYSNFFRDPCSTGIAGMPAHLEKKYFGGRISRKYREIALVEALHRYDLWKQRTGNAYSVHDLVPPVVGNPYGSTIDGVFLMPGVDYHHAYAHAIEALLPAQSGRVVAELGGGFGGMAYFLVHDVPNVTYIDFDLPEALALASYYLMKTLPDVPITLYGEAELTAESLRTPGILMMPSFEIMKMAPKSAAVTFNSYSLAEMAPSAIREYISEITRITNGHFLHVNHNKKAVLCADNFGVEDHGFELVYRKLAGWTSGLNLNSDEFEYLYKAD